RSCCVLSRRISAWTPATRARGPPAITARSTRAGVPTSSASARAWSGSPGRRPVASTISSLITSTESGDRTAADALFAALYSELHQLAERQLARRGGGVTIGATTLLHEAYLDISRREGSEFPDAGRFMAYAAKVMRGLIVDYARNRSAQKRGGAFEITSL